MKVLIFSMTCGEGHDAMAKALASTFEKYSCETLLVQTFGFDQKRVERENKTFLWACRHIPKIYDFVWNKLRKRDPNKYSKSHFASLKPCKDWFCKNIEKFNPDIILCTHFYASSVICQLKKEGLIKSNILTASLLTDFCVHPYWEFSSQVDVLIEPLENTTQDLINKNFDKDKIVALGLPTRDVFKKEMNKNLLRKKFALDDKFTVFVIAGREGRNGSIRIVKKLQKVNNDINIIILNGRDKQSFDALERYIKKHNIKGVINLGFVKNVEEYIYLSDAVISRAGATFLTELLLLGKPMLIRENRIINEKLNEQFFVEQGCAKSINKFSNIGNAVKELKENKDVCKKMSAAAKKFAMPNASDNIVEYLIKKKEQKDDKTTTSKKRR